MDNEFKWIEEADKKVSTLLQQLNHGVLTEKEFWSQLLELASIEYDKANHHE